MAQRYATVAYYPNLFKNKFATIAYYFTFAPMETHVDHVAAWKDFWLWIKEQPIWSDKEALPVMQKRYLYKAKWAQEKGHLGRERVKNILEKYAPGRYSFKEIVVLNGELMPDKTKQPIS